MWQPHRVELALFRWRKWRQSIISQWAETCTVLDELSFNDFRDKAKEEMQKLGFSSSLFLETYWVCCIASDYNLDYPVTYDNIVIPYWLSVPPLPLSARHYSPCHLKQELKAGLRIYPPPVFGESDIDFWVYQEGFEAAAFFRDGYYPKENDYGMFLPTVHELLSVLNKIRGRPKLSHKLGIVPSYSDRLVVKCTVLHDTYSMSYVKIARQLQLPVKKYYEAQQSDTVRHLVQRGKELIGELN